MNYASIKTHDIANGPGVRVSLYVSGCTHHCRECFNPETWDFSYGQTFDRSIENKIVTALSPSYIAGFSLLGGEPFEPSNSIVLAPFLKRLREACPGKTVWCYSGYRLDDELWKGIPGEPEAIRTMLSCIDVLIDGEFMLDKKVVDLRFRGSLNQRIIDVQKSLKAGEIVLWEDDGEMAAYYDTPQYEEAGSSETE